MFTRFGILAGSSACPKCGKWVEKTDYTVLAKAREVKHIFSLIAGNISLLVAINTLADRETTLEWARQANQQSQLQMREVRETNELISSPSRWRNDQWR